MKILLKISILILLSKVISFGQYEINIKNFESIKLNNEEQFNTSELEFSPFFYNDFIGFVYANSKSTKDKEINEHFFDLGISAVNFDGVLSKRASFNKNLNSEFHEGPASFVQNRGEFFFTRVYYDKSKLTKMDTIYRDVFMSNSRTNFEETTRLNFYPKNISVCHPTLNPQGNYMIYAGDPKGGKGQMDLYSTSGRALKWAKHKNLNALNSEGNEIFPFLYRDSMLFFASDRVGGKGGLDIYLSFKTDTIWSNPIALPYPFNTIYDDFGLILNDDMTMGYMSSSRPGGKGKDDIYSFKIIEQLWSKVKVAPKVKGIITILDKLTLDPIEGAQVIISDISLKNDKYDLDDFNVDVLAGEKQGEILMKLSPKENEMLAEKYSDDMGQVSYNFPNDKKYFIRCIMEGYEPSYVLYDPRKQESQINIVINPLPTPEPIKTAPVVVEEEIFIPTTVGEIVIFDNIYYDRNSAAIKIGAARELDALARTMLSKADMKVELSAHTDSRGTNDYNQELSLKRAISAKNYLISKGVKEVQIKAYGYGEDSIRNQCKNGVKCSEEQHEYNRRTEVKVVN